MNRIVVSLLTFIASVAIVVTHSVNKSAFCSSNYSQNVNFPSPNPPDHLPWIWDAMHDMTRNIVELTIIYRQSCSFKHDGWKQIVSLFPQYSDQLGFSLESNILVNVSQFKNKNKLEYPFVVSGQNHLKLDLVCVFLDDNKTVMFISHTKSGIVSKTSAHGTVAIECSAPPKHVTWSKMRVERNMTSLLDFYGMTQGSTIDVTDNATEAFSVCRLPEYKPAEKLFNLTVCTATANSNREQLVEWIEYHLLQGVQHFYLYNTAIPAYKQQHLQHTLSDYISQGIVTIIPWPYNNCVHKMASGRSTWYNITNPDPSIKDDIEIVFKPPKAIAQSAALASCYSRFKHTSKYITHIDDDEFLFVSQQRDGNKNNVKHKKSSSVVSTVLSYVQQIFDKHPNAPAVYFQPYSMLNCTKIAKYQYKHNTNPMIKRPPRLGQWNRVQQAPKYEGKLVMRTDAVKMFFVHYLTQLNGDNDHTTVSSGNSRRVWSKENIFTPYLKNAALLHFKALPPASGSIWGQSLPLNTSDSALQEQCDAAYDYNVFSIFNMGSSNSSSYSSGGGSGVDIDGWSLDFLKHKANKEMISLFYSNYKQRMN